MNCYVATFYSHFGALSFHKSLTSALVTAQLAPVPRKLSSSCGTCVRFWTDSPLEFQNEDLEAVYLCENDAYSIVKEY